jgi:hypothetical protein
MMKNSKFEIRNSNQMNRERPAVTHFVDRLGEALCGEERPEQSVYGTLVTSADITCEACRRKWLQRTAGETPDLFQK